MKLFKSPTYDPEKSIALIKKLSTGQVSDYINIETNDFDVDEPTDEEKMINLSADYYFCPLPQGLQNGHRMVAYMVGKSGTGKTTTLCNWVNNYRVLLENKNPVYLITYKDEDDDDTLQKELGDDQPIRIPPEYFDVPKPPPKKRGRPKRKTEESESEESEEEEEPEEPEFDEELGVHIPPRESDFRDSLVLFDDFTDGENSPQMNRLMRSLAKKGRSKNTSMFVIFHKPTNSHSTTDILLEATVKLFKVDSLHSRGKKYLLDEYTNIDSKKARKLIHKSNGIVCISDLPSYVILPQSVFIPKYM